MYDLVVRYDEENDFRDDGTPYSAHMKLRVSALPLVGDRVDYNRLEGKVLMRTFCSLDSEDYVLLDIAVYRYPKR